MHRPKSDGEDGQIGGGSGAEGNGNGGEATEHGLISTLFQRLRVPMVVLHSRDVEMLMLMAMAGERPEGKANTGEDQDDADDMPLLGFEVAGAQVKARHLLRAAMGMVRVVAVIGVLVHLLEGSNNSTIKVAAFGWT